MATGASETFVGRIDPTRAIHNQLTDKTSNQSVRIISISGPGGVGKSFLLEHVLSQLDLPHYRYLLLRINGNTSSLTIADLLVRDLVASAPPRLAGDPRYFSLIRNAWTYLQSIDAQAKEELQRDARKNGDDELARMVGVVFDGVVGVLEWIPHDLTKGASKVGKKVKGKNIEKVVLAAKTALAYQVEEGGLFGFLPTFGGKKERNLLRKDLSGRLAEYLTADLAAILSRYRRKDFLHFLPGKVADFDRLLLVLDDYEALEPTLDEFLRRDLLPRLIDQKFQTVLILLGRDRISDVNFNWEQYYQKNIVLDIKLDPLSHEESSEYLKDLGILNEGIRKRIIKETCGLPFLLGAEAECELRGGNSALALQKFVDRTTRWMSEEQRAWTMAIAFLDHVNTDTVRSVLPDSDPDEVVSWFKKEPSIRSPEAGKWTMLPIISSRIRQSVENDSPSLYRHFKERADQAAEVEGSAAKT